MKTATVLVLLLLLGGCASPSTLMANDAGQVRRCATAGWGWAGAPLAYQVHDRCVEDLKTLGYHEVKRQQ